MRIAIFGGTFDPPHLGHINLARSVIDGYHADKVLFVPAPNPPHKLNKQVTQFKHRIEMLRLSIDGEVRFDLTDMEQRRLPEPSFTVKTMYDLSKEYFNDHLFWLIGSDSLTQLHTWYKSEELVRKYNLIVYPRPDQNVTYDMLRQHWDVDDARKLYESILNLPIYNISSTMVREAIKDKKDVSKWLNSKVIDYIKEFNLYE